MRILNVSALIDRVVGGGTAERTARLSAALQRAGHDVTVLATDAGVIASGVKPDVGGARIDLLECLSERMLIPRGAGVRVAAAVRAAEVVHLCNHWTLLNLLAARAARRFKRPYVVCPAGALPVYGRSGLIKHLYNAAGGRSLVESADAWIAITPRERADFRAYGVEPGKVTVIPNGVDAEDYAAADTREWRARHGLGDSPLILFVGRLNTIKGPDLLIEAFVSIASKIPRHMLVMAGPDEGELERLRSLAAPLKERVRFIGFVSGQDKAAAYRAADLVVVPSRQEAMSLVALEAGVCGTPVLMTDVCGFDEAAYAGGSIVPASVAGLAAGMREMLGNSELTRRGEQLRELVLREFTWDAAAARYAKLFASVLRGTG